MTLYRFFLLLASAFFFTMFGLSAFGVYTLATTGSVNGTLAGAIGGALVIGLIDLLIEALKPLFEIAADR